MAKFKCITSNEVYEFTAEHDIKAMRSHPEYVEVVEDTEDKMEEPIAVVKKAGRPPKASVSKEIE